MSAAALYPDDTCALKEDPTILAIVERTSHDVDGGPFPERPDWIENRGIPQRTIISFFKSGVLPKNYVAVSFVEPHSGFSILHENDLELIDRTFVIGDTVKKNTSDAMSGLVVRTSMVCTLLSVYPGLELKNKATWPPQEERILRKIPGEELSHIEDFLEGDYIIYHGWIGVVSSVYADVTIRLSNGSVVQVENPDEIGVPIVGGGQSHMAMMQLLRAGSIATRVKRHAALQEQGSGSSPVSYFFPGQHVVTKKVNLRRGDWKFGAYDANVPPKGTVVHVQESNIRVTWLPRNVYTKGQEYPDPPPEYLADDELWHGDVYAYNDGRLSSETEASIGAMKGSKLVSGDHVKFQDIAGAAVKYSEGSEHGTLRRIPRTETQGYDMNVYLVRETNLKLLIHWQNGSVSEEEAKNVVPYLNLDEHEVWPGQIVAIKDNENVFDQVETVAANTDLFNPSRVGVVQTADARERTAVVRWFAESSVQILNSSDPALLPGSTLGTLSQECSEVSCFEIVVHPALANNRGDMVLIQPNNQNQETPSGTTIECYNSTISDLTNQFPSSSAPTADGSSITRSKSAIHNWFGTVVDLRLDGMLMVRLGGLDNIRDIKVPIERVTTLVEVGDEGFLEDEDDMDDEMDSEGGWSDFDDGNDPEDRVIEEIVEYEGGRRMSADGGDDMWMTDDDDGSPADPVASSATANIEPLASDGVLSSSENNTSSPERPLFSSCPDMPVQFAILDESSPHDLHYISTPVILHANLMRRIRKEHKILANSLPDGIWVRTWADRLDLVRVLIIGAACTPYNLAPFVIDFQFPQEFPKVPPNAHFHSWTNGLGRINPNLYEDGKICLSLLGTWSGEGRCENWSETGSSMLQVIVSLMGLVLVNKPYYNEAGYEALANSRDYELSAHQYSERVVVMCKGFVVHAVSHEISGLSDVIAWLYNSSAGEGPELLACVVSDSTRLLRNSERARDKEALEAQATTNVDAMDVDEGEREKPDRLSSGAMLMLRKYIKAMQGCLEKCGYTVTDAEDQGSTEARANSV